VLLVGAGAMGRVHADAWAEIDAPVACVVDPDGGRARALADRAGAHACTDLQAALARHPIGRGRAVEAVDVCVPTPAHVSVLAALPAGRYLVVTERPLGRDPAEARAAASAARTAGYDLFVAHVVRFFPAYRAIAETVRERGADDVWHARLTRIGPAPRGAGDWFLDEGRSGGIFLDLMIHDLDFALDLFGPPGAVVARAGGAQAGGAARHGAAWLSYPGRRVVHLEASWMYDGPFTTAVDLNAAWGTLALEPQSPTLELPAADGDGGGRRARAPLARTPYGLELEAAWRAHAAGKAPPVDADAAVRAVRLASLCRDSARLGRTLPWPGDAP